MSDKQNQAPRDLRNFEASDRLAKRMGAEFVDNVRKVQGSSSNLRESLPMKY